MASVEEYYKELGVVHSDECWICDFEVVPGLKRSLVRSLWIKWYTPWALIVVMLVVAYIVAIETMYIVIGGL